MKNHMHNLNTFIYPYVTKLLLVYPGADWLFKLAPAN